MNDRFKFRVWDKQDGCYAYSNNSDVGVLCIETDGELTYSVYKNDYEDFNYIPESEVIIEQCTGLKDKNGKLIYEGDICIPAKDMADKAGEVYRAESGAYFIKGRMKSGMEYDFGIYWHHYMYEIIGNIHENADLLGE